MNAGFTSSSRRACDSLSWTQIRLQPCILALALALAALAGVPRAAAGSISYPLSAFTLINANADGTVESLDGVTASITGGNNGSGLDGTTDLQTLALVDGTIQFHYLFLSADEPGFDWAGYVVSDIFTQLADTSGDEGDASFPVLAGQLFGFRVETADNGGEPGVFTVSSFDVPVASPEPLTMPLSMIAIVFMGYRLKGVGTRPLREVNTMKASLLTLLVLIIASALTQTARAQTVYAGAPVTGQLFLSGTVNLTQLAQGTVTQLKPLLTAAPSSTGSTADLTKLIPFLHPPLSGASRGTIKAVPHTAAISILSRAGSVPQALAVSQASVTLGFDGLTHAQQQLANNGNQYNVEPPSPSIAVGNGYVLEGVNNAIQIYNTSGTPVLAKVLSSNEVFGLAPAINQANGVAGPFPTDMRVYYDSGMNRWFILQRAQDNDTAGNLLPSSHLYMAVSQTGDPSATFNNYVMDTSDQSNFFGCPCFPDYLQIGSDQYGFYIAANEYNAFFPFFVDATVLAISKASLTAGAAAPTAVQFTLPFATGYEFAIQPATTPPGASTFLASGGVEFLVSTQGRFAIDSALAVWAMTNTSTLWTSTPSLKLMMVNTTVQSYSYPDVANQKPGTLTYGSTLKPPGQLAFLDGSDDRVLSVSYAGGRLYVTTAASVVDSTNHLRVGGAYYILSPTLRAGVLNAPVLRQGTLVVNGNHLLRPSVAVNAQGNGAIVFTVVGSDYFPSVAFVPISVTSTSSAMQIVAAGTGPEDGFSGYIDTTQVGVARWGDYATAVAASDGSIWMTAEYIPNAPRVPKANWGTYVFRYVP